MADEFKLRTVQLQAASLTQNFGLNVGSEDYRSHPSLQPDKPEAIFQAMVRKDEFKAFDPKTLKGTVYSLKNRSIISRWVRDVCVAFNLKSTTLCLAVQLTDHFVLNHLNTLQLSHCQLSAITSVWIAAKFEELDANLPSLKALVEVCDGAYTAEQMIDMEETLLASFRWKVPHTTVNNYLYFYLHLLASAQYLPELPKVAAPADDRLALKLIRPPGSNDTLSRAQLKQVSVVLPYTQPLFSAVPSLCNTLGVNSSGKGTIEVYRILGDDVVLAQRLDPQLSPAQLGILPGEALFLATSSSSCVFTAQDHVSLLRPLNTLMLHLCETLLQQTLLHPEFLKVNRHLSAMAVLVATRCLLSSNPEGLQAWSNNICRSLEISRTQTVTVVELLMDKYSAAMEADPSSFAQPLVPVPPDWHDRLLLAFGRRQPQQQQPTQ